MINWGESGSDDALKAVWGGYQTWYWYIYW